MQKKIELLAPAGNMEALKAAVAAGCDAVYLGGTGFSARAFAGNFDHEEMVQAITYCHRCFLLSFIIRWKAGRLSVFPETAASE